MVMHKISSSDSKVITRLHQTLSFTLAVKGLKCNFFFNFSLIHTYTLDVAPVYVTSPVQLTDCKVLSLTDLSGGEE